jgi:hypothetical protein
VNLGIKQDQGKDSVKSVQPCVSCGCVRSEKREKKRSSSSSARDPSYLSKEPNKFLVTHRESDLHGKKNLHF